MKKNVDWWQVENGLFAEGFLTVCGVDEAGRGPLAGPVCAAAVILPAGLVIDGLDDSKKLSPKKRESLYEIITQKAVSWGAAFASVEEIERLNILEATFLAMNRAIGQLSPVPDIAVIDGNRSSGVHYSNRCVIGGDGLSESVAAASVIAKVTRDRLMVKLDAAYPQYGFAKHKGYGTAEHYEMIRKYGPCPIHRLSFIKKCTERRAMAEQKLLGRWGEALAAEYLRGKKYEVVALNYATRFGEVDLIAENRKFVVFVEVKLRKDSRFAEAKEFVTREKQRRILAAAGQWLSENENGKQPRFDVVEIYAPEGTATAKPQIIHTEDAFGADR